MSYITEYGIYLRQHSRIILLHKLRGVKNFDKYLNSNESKELIEDEASSLKLEYIRDLFIFTTLCFTFCVVVLIIELILFYINLSFCKRSKNVKLFRRHRNFDQKQFRKEK